jgi:hypothetical protein
LRGGSWNNKPNNLRSANRNRNNTGKRNNNNGFCLIQSALKLHCSAPEHVGSRSGVACNGVSMNRAPGQTGNVWVNSLSWEDSGQAGLFSLSTRFLLTILRFK